MTISRTLMIIALFSVLAASCTSSQVASDNSASTPAGESGAMVVTASQVEWEHLNPARGDKAPSAGTLWGDRNGSGPTGFLLRPADGFESPPHIHNVSYRGVVIRGVLHNDDPDAAKMWLPAGSFWTQPKGEVHITAARGTDALAYIEIEEGPYLVLPKEEAFDSGERPVNVDESNIVWLDATSTTWIDQPEMQGSADGPEVAFLWGDPRRGERTGSFIKLPADFNGEIRTHGSSFRAVVIQGHPEIRMPGASELRKLDPGSYFSSAGDSVHQVSSGAVEESIIYVRIEGRFRVTSARHAR